MYLRKICCFSKIGYIPRNNHITRNVWPSHPGLQNLTILLIEKSENETCIWKHYFNQKVC